ncbi:thiamine-phosphate kinase [Intrasporangium calvum]|uniref:Thiamine-monophosphate kinase n=1 Tax=Intrasporangium calvum TaxID=53358 RepID=A0ABT5GHS5_9MICO|nr:thiamine-phosphate kinase [Intrasporangium calvum]MDC5697231.1 thiamine-phosphate kinase [Intrasporangium calvum]
MSTRTGPSLTGGTPLRGLDEEEVLGRILPLFAPSADLIVPPGDDAAVLATESRTIVTTDTVVLGRDWLDAWSSGADVGTKVVAQNLADVAAMGGRPTGVLVTLVADPMTSIDWVVDLAAGIAAACQQAGVAVLGGDLSSAPAGVVMVSVTALGNLAGAGSAPVLRSGARAGDRLAVRGSLGLAAAGLHLLMHDQADRHPEAVNVQRRPDPPLEAGPEAAAAGASAMLDVSDGLVRDGGRIARASGVVLELDRDALREFVAQISDAVGEETAWDCVLAGGEEHSLLATFPGEAPAGWHVIGAVRSPAEGEQPGVLLDGVRPQHSGWDHFRNGEGRRP